MRSDQHLVQLLLPRYDDDGNGCPRAQSVTMLQACRAGV